jgi:hypothetical protein
MMKPKMGQCDGMHELFYPNFVVFIVFGPRAILIFWIGLQIGPKGVVAHGHFSNLNMHFLD